MATIGNGQVFGGSWAGILNAFNWTLAKQVQPCAEVRAELEPLVSQDSCFIADALPNRAFMELAGSAHGRAPKTPGGRRPAAERSKKPADPVNRSASGAYDADVERARMICLDPKGATIADVRWLCEKGDAYRRKLKDDVPFMTALFLIISHHPADDVRDAANEAYRQYADAAADVLRAMASKRSPREISESDLWSKLEAASIIRDGDRDDVGMAHAVFMLLNHFLTRETFDKLLYHAQPAVRDYVIMDVVEVRGGRHLIPKLWKFQKPLIQGEVDRYRENLYIAQDAITLLAEFAVYGVDEAGAIIANIISSHEDASLRLWARRHLELTVARINLKNG